MKIPYIFYSLFFLICCSISFVNEINAQCPTVQFVDLRGTPGFPQTDNLNVCGTSDTLSILMFTDAPGDIQGFEFTVNMISGMRYAGFEEAHYGGCTDLSNTNPDVSSPQFVGAGITCGDIFVANIGVTADCSVDLASNDYFIEIDYSYTYFPPTGGFIKCKGTEVLENDFNGALKVPVLNMANPAPIDVTVTSLGTPACQNFQISQDGLQAYVSEFNFAVCGLDIGGSSPVSVSTMTANGIDILGSAIYNPADTSLTANIDNSFFAGNSSPNANGTPDQFDTAEKVSIQVCYEVANCPAGADLPFSYKAWYGCFDEVCQQTGQSSFLKVRPSGSLLPDISSTLDNGITICGADAQVTATVTNPNTDTDQNVYTDLSIGFQACGMEAFNITDVMINGISVPPLFEIIGSDIDIDLSINTDPGIGLVDYDGDGFFDDLPGGSAPLNIVVSFGLGCGIGTDGGCPEINCDNVQFYLKGKTNCGNNFQGFPPTGGFDLQYGQEAVSNLNEVALNNSGSVLGYDFGIYSSMGGPVGQEPESITVEFCYDFAQENIADCPSGGDTKMLGHFGGPKVFIDDVAVVPGSVMMDDGSGYTMVPDSDVSLTITSEGSATIEINAGSNSSTLCYKYDLILDECHCTPAYYVSLDQQIVSICSDCTPDCEIVKGCRPTLLKADGNCSPCPCIADYTPVLTERENLGYVDKEMTRKITRQEIIDAGATVDLSRFMPGDTLRHQGFWEILDAEQVLADPMYWLFRFVPSPLSGAANHANVQAALPLSWDGGSIFLNELKFENPDGTIHIFDRGDFAECAHNGSTPRWNSLDTNFDTNWGDPGDIHESTYPCVYSAWEGYDHQLTDLWLYNYDRVKEVGGTWENFNDGNCLQAIIETFNLVQGTKVHFDFSVPLIKNPLREQANILGLNIPEQSQARIQPSFIVYNADEFAGSATLGAAPALIACRENAIYNVSCPGGLKSETNIVLDNCGGTIEHEFVVSAFAGPSGDEWFTQEYRPLIEIHDLELPIYSPLAYCANAQVEQNGQITPVVVDSVQNMSCSPVAGFSDALCAVDGGTEGAIVIDLYDQGFYGLGIGLDNCDTIRLSYDYCMVCPAPLNGLLDYQLKADWCTQGQPSDCAIGAMTFYSPGNDDGLPSTFREVAVNAGFAAAHNVNSYNLFNLDTLYCHIDDTQGIVFIDESAVTPTMPVTATNTDGSDLLASGSPGTSIEVKEVEFCNPDPMDATGFSGYVSLPNAVLFEGACLDAAGTMPLVATVVSDDGQVKKYQIDFPSDILATTDCISVFVKTTLLFCPTLGSLPPEICVGASSGCSPAEVRAAIGGSGSCSSSEVCYAYIFGEADLQTEWFSMPVNPKLCEPMTLHVRTKNVKELLLLGVDPSFTLPSGMMIVPNSWEVAYPGGTVDMMGNFGAWTSVPDPDQINGNDYGWLDEGTWSQHIEDNGLLGVSSTLDSNTVSFRFQVTTDCDKFLSGSKPSTETLASDPCGPEDLSSGNVESPAIIIDGANPADYAQILAVGSPSELYCGGLENQFGLTALNVSDNSTTDSVVTCLTIPGDYLDYAPGSVSFTNGFIPAYITETPVGSNMEVCFHSPSLAPGAAWSVIFEAAMVEGSPCVEIPIGADIKSVVESVACTPGPPAACDVFVQNSLNPIILIDLNPPLATEGVRASMDCSAGTDPVQVCYEVDLSNPGPAYNGNVRVGIHDDVTANGTLESFDSELNGMDHMISLANGEMITLEMCLDIPAIQACPIIIKTTFETDCSCDSNETPFMDLSPSFIADLEECTVMCPTQPLVLETCGNYDITLEPASGGTVTDDGTGSLTIALNDGFGVIGTDPVQLVVTGTTGECDIVDMVDLKSIGDWLPENQSADICENDCVDLDLLIPSELEDGATITWTPTIGLDDPTIATPEVCGLTADQVYNVEIKFNDACSFNIDYTVTYNPNGVTNITGEEFCLCQENGTLIGGLGFASYEWYSLQSGAEILEAITTTNTWTGPSVAGDYILKAYLPGAICPNISNVVTLEGKECVDLELEKNIINIPSPVVLGSQITYELVVCNIQDDALGLKFDATNVEISDELPGAVTYVQHTQTTGNYSPTFNQWDISLLESGDCETLLIDVVINDKGIIENTAQISGADQEDIDSETKNDDGDQSEDDEDAAIIEVILANIGDQVFIDADGDGIQDPGEPGLEGVTVNIYDANTGLPIATTATDANGNYLFEDLPSGDYYIDFDLSTTTTPGASNYIFTTPGTGDGTNDSEADANGQIPTFSFDASNGDDLTRDAGVVPADCDTAMDQGIDICLLITNNPTHPLAIADCDGGGVDNATECSNGYDPFDDSDECDAVVAAGLDLCAIIGGDSNHPLALLDCDGGGINNLTECNFGGDPSIDATDDCSVAIAANVDICAIVMNDPNHPLATADCDGGGIDNLTECSNGTDPSNPSDDCTAALAEGEDLCALINGNPLHPLANADCDGGGVDNLTECNNGTDPAAPADDCTAAIAAGLDICAIIAADPSSPLATADCDGGGVDNLTECNNGTDPAAPADDCTAAIASGLDICALIGGDVNHPLATADCDGGGVDNLTECNAGADPANSADECTAAAAAGLDVCAIIAANPASPLATLDCDGGGVDNATECANGGDPLDAADECTSVIAAGLDLCAIIGGDASHPLALLDCDGGGIDNLTECNFGGDPSVDPSDDCSIAIAANVDICAIVMNDPNHPLATADCDGGGVDNLTECNNGADPSNPSDDCTAAIAEGIDLCALINGNPTHPLASADCDGGGVDNITECNNGGDPADDADDCTSAIAAGLDLCAIIAADPSSPLATADCDGGGVDNLTECNNGTDPAAPADDCTAAIASGLDICALIGGDVNHPLATADCDGGGVDNLTECSAGADPANSADECTVAAAAGLDVCAIIAANPSSALATLDCDGGGVDNATECANGGDPLDAADECTSVIAAGLDLCAIIAGDANHPLASLDCDGGGIDNLTECNFGGDPSVDPSDDCSIAIAANVDICAIVMNDPNHPLATADCDGGGVDNLTECNNGADPSNPSDDCTAAIAEGIDICALINGNPTHPLASADCDGGGVDNITECNNGGDPADDADDCSSAIAAGLDLCAIIAADPSSPLATADCDGGGVDNLTECNNGTDPAAPADDCTAAIASGLDICALIGGDVNHPLATADCDGGGVDNLTECNAGTDPGNSADECTVAAAAGLDVCAIIAANPGSALATLDCDGGGVDNATECANGGDPLDAADECTSVIAAGLDLCAIIGGDASHPLALLDCDGGGIDNLTECNFGGDPSVDPSDDCSIAIAANVDICAIVMNDPNHPLATADCDGGGVDNLTECNNGADPSNPSDDCTAAIAEGIDICALLAADPTNALATADCDGGGVDNITECNNGGDPADESDDCTYAIAAGLEICAIIAADPSSPLATADCDGGGVDNLTECNNGTDPAAPADDCTAAIASGLDICALIGGDVNHPLAGTDCDGGGVDNLTECNTGADPANSADECTAAAAAGLDVCAIIAANPASPLATLDCDGGGVDNATECANGGDPLDAADECTSVIAAGLDLCAIIAGDASHPLASLDCDGGGIDNLTECNFGGDPSVDPSDDCSIAIAANVDICAIVMNDPNHPLATADCDGGGVDNLTECNNGADPSNPSDDCTAAIAEGIDICALINGNPTHPLASADCDGGGVDNITECNNGGDPADDADDCSSAIAAGLDLCAIIATDPSSPLAKADCDGGGVDNLTECNNGTDPAAPADDCTAAIASGLDICSLIGGDVNHPLAGADCDGGGVDNLTECNAGADPGNSADECTAAAASGLDVCAIIAANPGSALATLDCDGGGVDNATECANGGDPLDAADECTSVIAAGLDLCAIIAGDANHPLASLDCDGGGIDNLTECNFGGDPSLDPSDDCSIAIAANVDICAIVMNDPNHPLATADCDGGGVDNLTECNNGADPSNPSDDCTAALAEGIDICALLAADPTNALATADCDGGGVDNATECANGGDPADESDDCTSAIAAGLDICAIIAANPSSPLATADCDGGGVDNLTECNAGFDPADPADECDAAITANVDICTIVMNDPNHPLAMLDCDGGGVDNLTECQAGNDPANSADECDSVAAAGLDVCAIIAANPGSALATLDCDGGGVDNATECANGGDPLDAADECTSVIAAGLDVCAIIAGDASHPLASLDCDGGGIDNLTECNFGGEPSTDPSDDCSIALAANVDICAVINGDPNHPLATADCDGGGIDNLTECNNGTDPSNPADDCSAAIAEGIDICALIAADPTNALATADCDGGGVDNTTECNNGNDPSDPADDVAGITGQLWVDADGDGVQDPGEPGLEGVTVNLLDPVTGEVIATTTTDADGNYEFPNIPSGEYQIGFDPSTSTYGDDTEFTTQDNGPDGIDSDVNIGGLSEVFTFDAGLGDQDIIDGGIILTPEIGTVKWIIGSTTLPNGDLEVEFGLGIKNIGTVDLSNISLVDDLATQLGAGFISVVGTPVLINSDATSSPALNTAFDGVANLDVFTGAATDLLEPGQEVRLSITTLIDPTMAAFPLMNQADAQAFGRDANGNLLTDAGGAPITATDASDSGEMFENDNPGEPGDAGTSDDPTLIECFPANIIVTGEEDPICFGAAANLVVTSDFTNVQYQWTEVGSTTVLSTSATPSFSPTATTDYLVSLTVFDDVCVFDLEQTITITVLPEIIIDVVSDYTPNTDCSPSDLSFEVLEAGVSSSFASYAWTGPNSFTSSEATPVIANAGPENNGSYTVLVTDANGCTASATIQVEDVVAQSVSDPIITSSGPVCEGEAITLSTALQSGVNVSYTWTMPSTTDVSGQGTNEIVIFPLDESIHAGDYTVTVNVDGCEVTSAIFTVEALTGSMAMPSEAGTPICEGENMFLEANAPTGVTFAWSGPNGFTSDQRNPVLTNVSEANNGIYTLTVSNAEGCVSVSEITINSVLPPAETPTIAVNGPNCAGEPIELSTSTNGMMFEWIGPLGASTTTLMGPGLTTGTPNTSIDDSNDSYLSGDWRVQVTDANGCTSISEPISVGINDVPQAIIINNGDVCDGEVLKLSANTVEGASYAWYDADPAMGGNLISQEQNIEFFDMTPNTYTYYLQVDAQGCPSEVAFSSVTVNENPSTLPDFAYMSNVDCAASDLELIANTTGTGPFTYLWSGPNGFTSTQENPVIPGAAAQSNGSYTLQIVDANGCQSEVNSLEVEGVETAVAQPVITSSGPACNGQTITLSVPAYAGSNVSYIWTTPSGFTNITGQTSNVLIISPVDEGVHTGDFSVQVVVDDCTVTSSAFAVEIFPAPTAAISATTSSICPGGELELFSNAANAVGYAWTGPNGFSSNAAEIVIPNVSTQNNGTYSLVVTSQSGCSSTVSYVVDNISDEGVTPTLLMDMDICAGEDIVLSTSAVGAQYEWISPLGDNPSNITTATSSTVVSMGAADYLAGNWSVRVTDANGCTTTSETVSLLINDIPVALARNNGPICEDSGDIQLIGNEVPNATYAWYQGDPATGGTLFSTDMSPTLFAPAVGVQEYYLVVSQEGCASAASMTEVDVTARPESTPAAVYNLSPDCALEDLNLESNAVGVGPFTYLWSGPNGFTSTQANPSIENITEEGNGSYSLSLIDANGCESFNTVELNNISNPQAQPVVSTTGVSCDDGAIVLSTQAYFGTNVTYTWTTPNGTVQDISGLETNEITISPVDVDVHDGDYTLTVVVDDCTLSSAPFNLEVLEEPIAAQPTAVSDGVCVGEDILLESEVAADYLWSGPNGFTSDLQFPVISNPSLAAAGTYFLTVFNEQGCQSDPVSIDITVDVQPAPPTIVVADNIICDTEDIVLRTSSQCDEYRWIGPGGSSVTTLANPLLTTTANNTTIPVGDEAYAGGMWSVICVNGNGCASENSAALMVEVIDVENPVPATSQFVSCNAEQVTLFAGEGYEAGTQYMWYDADPSTTGAILVSNQQNPTLAEQINSGSYTYWLQIEQEGCLSEAVPVTVTVPDAPIASATNDGTECISSTDDVNLSVELSNGTAPFNYAWSGPNGFVSVQASTQLPNAANGSSGVYVVTVTDANGCTAVSETVVDVTVVPEEPVLQYASSLCQGSEFVINAPQYTGEQVTYFWTGPNGSTLDGTYPDGHEIVIEEVDQNDAGDYEVYVVVNGCTSSTSSIVPVFVNTLPEVAPSNDGVLCAEIENDLNLAANVVGGQAPYTFNWSGPNGFNSQAENPQLSNLGIEASGTYTLYVTDANGCESVIQSTSVSVSELPATPTLEVSAEQICENGQLVLSTQTYNNSNVTYTWIMADGTMIDTNDPVLLIDQADQAVHDGFISVMVTVNGCTSYQASHVFVEVSDQPAAPALANTTSELSPACEGMDVQLSTPLIIGANYTWYGPNGFTSNLPSPSISDVDLSDVGTYSLVVEIDGCTSEAVQTEVYVDPMPDIPVADNEGPACVEMDVVLRVLNPDPEVLYTWYRALDNFVVGTGATLILPAVSMEDAGGYYVTGSSDECVSEASNITEVVINSVPVANAYAGEDDIVCEPDYTIGGNSISEGEGFWTNITPNGQTQIVDPSQAQTLVRDLAIGENQFVWTLSNGACENTSTDTISITYNADPMVTDDNYNIAVKELLEASILDNDQANAAFFTVSAVTEPSFGTLTLNPDGTFSYLPNENFAGMDTYTYELCHDFCPDNCVQATVNIQVGDGVACYAPTIITPNDDGLNDNFTIPCLSNYDNSNMCIFNRWGDEVYRNENYRNEWNGTYRDEGTTLPSGTYYYILQVNDGNNTVLTGYVFIQR